MNRSRIARALGAAVALASALTVGAPAATAALPPAAPFQPAALLRWHGEGSSATGNAVANGPCDVNGDGYSDSVVGAWFWDKAPINNVGAAYVVFGGADLQAGSLDAPGAVGAVRIDGPHRARSGSNGYSVGLSVGCLGDVDADGFDDIGIGDYQEQQIFVVFGAADFQPVGVDALGSRGFVVAGDPVTGGNVGYSMSALGDVNGDGRDDFAVAEIAADTQGRTNNGRIWVVAGRADIDDVDLTAPSPGDVLFTVDGATNEERLSVVSSVGDVNGDGIDDVLLGSYVSTPFGAAVAATGAAYVVFGGATGAVDAAALGASGFTITGPARQRDRLGVAVSAIGDVNGDGLADLLIGADGVSNATTGPRNGGAVVVFGSASTATVHTDPTGAVGAYSCAAGSTLGACDTPGDVQPRGYWIDGAAVDQKAGFSVAGIGDVNADDVPDLLIGAWSHDPVDPADGTTTMSNAGAAYVVFGKTTSTPQSLAALTDAEGFELLGLAPGDRFGRQVAALGDIDGNGAADFAVGADFAVRPLPAATGLEQAGELLVALMGEVATTTVVTAAGVTSVDGAAELTATVTIQGGTPAGAGTVTFLRNGAPVAGCVDVPVDTAGLATCATTLPAAGVHQLTASYGGATGWAASASAQLPVTVPEPPVEPGPVDPEPEPTPDVELPDGASTYVAVTPCRLADTRSQAGAEVVDVSTIRVVAAGRCGVPADATAVAISLTADAAADVGYATAWPAGEPQPNASNLNYGPGQTRANGAIIPLGEGGAIDVASFVEAGLLVDVSGAFVPADGLASGRFSPLAAERLLDTRPQGAVPGGGTVSVPRPASVPADATAVALNVTITESTGSGYVTAWPAGAPMPEASVVNADGPGQTRAAGVIVPVGDGGIELFASSEMQLIADVTGFFTGTTAEPSTEGLFVPRSPERLLDTRAGAQLAAGDTIGLTIDDVDAVALAANVTIVDPVTAGWVVAYPAGAARPATSTVNASAASENAASLALLPVGADGLAIYADSPTDVLVDRTGYFTAELAVENPQEPPAEPVDTTPQSVAYAQRNWVPTEYDTCPASLHASYSTIGPDGKRYPTWHPPTVVDPATGRTCTFGHEHGDDPATSDIAGWALEYFAPAGASRASGIPFGLSSEALVDYAAAVAGQVVRHEDHVGHKVFVANDVKLVAASPRGYVRFTDGSGASVPVECDYLIKTHQGSHSADATTNNAHELFYAVRCNDGTAIAATVMSRFGDANEYTRSCDRSVTVATSGSNLPDGDGGARLIPDRTCVEEYVLVDPTDAGERSDLWSLYEVWQSASAITTTDGRTLASFDPWFAVRNPSRYGWSAKNADGSDGIGHTLDASWETGAGDAGVVNAQPWLAVCTLPQFPVRSPQSPFDGAERDFYLGTTAVANAGGPTVWYTDPWGGHASTTPFTGSIRQWIGATDNTWYPALERQNLGLGTDYNDGQGVHAPN